MSATLKKAYSGKRVLVTGHSGFKGSWLCEWLLELGAEVCGFSSYIPSKPSHFEVIGLRERLQNELGAEKDIRNLNALKKTIDDFRPQVLFHIAAQPIVTTSFENPKLTFDTNCGGTVNLLEAVRHSKDVEACVVITSDKCYENVTWEYGYRENDRLGGKDPYSASKACAEIAFSAYARSFFLDKPHFPFIASARAGNVIGGGDWAKDRIVADCVRAWSEKEELYVRNPDAIRPWQHVLEPLGGYLWLGAELLAKREGLNGESFNFGPGADVNQPGPVLIQEMGKPREGGAYYSDEPSERDEGKREAALLKLCCDKALHRLNWRASLQFSETIKMTVEWYMAYYRGEPGIQKLSLEQIRAYTALAKKRGLLWAN